VYAQHVIPSPRHDEHHISIVVDLLCMLAWMGSPSLLPRPLPCWPIMLSNCLTIARLAYCTHSTSAVNPLAATLIGPAPLFPHGQAATEQATNPSGLPFYVACLRQPLSTHPRLPCLSHCWLPTAVSTTAPCTSHRSGPRPSPLSSVPIKGALPHVHDPPVG
jgi:hypothetical protein